MKELVVDGADLSHENEPNLVMSDPSVSDLNLQLITVSSLESAFALSENLSVNLVFFFRKKRSICQPNYILSTKRPSVYRKWRKK